MRYPVNDWDKWYSAQGFGNKTTYGFHDGEDLNLKSGGNTDLGQPILAISDGEVTSVHEHTTGFGKHIHIKHTGAWGEVFCHYAHCNEVFVKAGDIVKEGQQVATLGSTGNSEYAHLHWAIKLQPTGIDGIADTQERLALWTSPIEFVEKWSKNTSYRGYDLSNQDSMKICVDDHIKIVEGQLVEKSQYETVKGQLTESQKQNEKISYELGETRGQLTSALEKIKSQNDTISSYVKEDAVQLDTLTTFQKERDKYFNSAWELTRFIGDDLKVSTSNLSLEDAISAVKTQYTAFSSSSSLANDQITALKKEIINCSQYKKWKKLSLTAKIKLLFS